MTSCEKTAISCLISKLEILIQMRIRIAQGSQSDWKTKKWRGLIIIMRSFFLSLVWLLVDFKWSISWLEGWYWLDSSLALSFYPTAPLVEMLTLQFGWAVRKWGSVSSMSCLLSRFVDYKHKSSALPSVLLTLLSLTYVLLSSSKSSIWRKLLTWSRAQTLYLLCPLMTSTPHYHLNYLCMYLDCATCFPHLLLSFLVACLIQVFPRSERQPISTPKSIYTIFIVGTLWRAK